MAVNSRPSPIGFRLFPGCLALLQLALFLFAVIYCFYPFPFLDHLDFVFDYADDGIASFFAPHNGHRLPVLRLLVVLDMQLFHGRLFPVISISLAALAVLAGTFISFVSKPRERESTAILASLIVMTLARGYTLPDYVMPITAHFVLSVAFAALALAAAARDDVRYRYAKAMAYGFICAGCSANGLAIFPALAWVWWRRGGSRLATASLIGISVLLPLVYFHGVKLDAVQPQHPWNALLFVLQYFGMPWQRVAALNVLAYLQGFFTLAILFFFALRFAFRGPILPAQLFAIGLAAFLVATALMTAFARVGMVDLHTQGSRYSVFVAAMQAVLLLLLWPTVVRVYERLHARRWMGQLAFTLLALGFMGEVVLSAHLVHARTEPVATAAAHICAGKESEEDLGRIYFSNDGHAHPDQIAYIRDFITYIRAHNLYCFRQQN